jgi:Icc protein
MNARPLQTLKIVQVSDCHLPSVRGQLYRGLDADRSLARLLPLMRDWQPDVILLTGDVSEDGGAASYGRISASLCSVGAEVLALPGNHDDPAVMQRYFRDGPWRGPLFRSFRGWQLVLLDSTERDLIGGALSADTLSKLEAGLQRSEAPNVLLALHHQPVQVGSPWIDRYALDGPEPLLEIIDRHPAIRGVTWGHVHQDFSSERNGKLLFGSPSTVANSIPGRQKFTLDIAGPACRWFRLHPDGDIETGLLRA